VPAGAIETIPRLSNKKTTAMLRSGSHRKVPFQMLLFGLVLIGAEAYQEAGPKAAQFAVKGSLQKLLIQVPAGIIAVFVASRFIDFDVDPLTVIALKIAGITVLAEGVACWVPVPFFSMTAELAVMLVGFFWLFELSKWETYFLVLLNFAALFGARYVVDNYLSSPRSFWSTSSPNGRRNAGQRSHNRSSHGLIQIE
jgi:hypothetical protein